ncbi:MAG: NAD(P)-binding domain-containing protein [Gammaproteobacteria bacterium]|nr:NAD(P)-binding domain-containing protein [Gammaproteobacteria bacterium]
MTSCINSQTRLCISIAARPGNFGTRVHNAGFRALGLNYVYKACGCSDLAGAIAGVRALNIHGCSVSMPFKRDVLPLLDDVDEQARSIGAVNTIVNEHGRLRGFNTDVYAATELLKQLAVPLDAGVLVLGAGGVARAIVSAMVQRGMSTIRVANRHQARGVALATDFGVEVIEWDSRTMAPADLLINATSVGMPPDGDAIPVPWPLAHRPRWLLDVVVAPGSSRLVRLASAAGVVVADGEAFAMAQAARQFELYTGRPAPLAAMRAAVESET